ncbi:TPA: DNA polymerase [Pseudomonas aeruginosa]|nr:DNA polymerase [Pseudomonas aeruginosa]
MRIRLFDCETDGLLHQLTRIHSLVIKDPESGEVWSCADRQGYHPIKFGLKMLMEADLAVGHNILKFDVPALNKVYPWFTLGVEKMRDTLILSRLLWPDLGDRDMGLIKKGKLPGKLRGSHGLEAWGHRLGLHKGDYAAQMEAKGLDPWAAWNVDMQDYCELDVDVTERLWEKINQKEIPDRAVELEHWFAHIIGLQEQFGFAFDVEKAVELYAKLAARRLEIDEELKAYFKPWYINDGLMVPKRPNRTMGYVEGAAFCKIKLQEFNPSSRQQIGDRLGKLFGWKPKEFTENGQPQIDETILAALPYPPAKLLSERFTIEKRIGQLAEGSQAWLKLERNGRIHGSVNTIGAVTGRCTHANPNVAQVPSGKAAFGDDCRKLFHVPVGWKQVGADASGLELRCLAHYMARYDGGEYGKVLLEGDIHKANQEAAGLPTRDNAKTFIYAFLYGAGDEKIGSIVGKGAKEGKRLKDNFLKKTPALARLREDVVRVAKTRKYLLGIDGRQLHVRSEHSALNTLLQSAGALLVKQATVNLYLELSRRGYIFGKHWGMVAHVHDEFQLQVLEEIADEVAEVACWAFREAGKQFNWRCPLDGEAKIGMNWYECH